MAAPEGVLRHLVRRRRRRIQGCLSNFRDDRRFRGAARTAAAELAGRQGTAWTDGTVADRRQRLALSRSYGFWCKTRTSLLWTFARHHTSGGCMERGGGARHAVPASGRRERLRQVIPGARRAGAASDRAGCGLECRFV